MANLKLVKKYHAINRPDMTTGYNTVDDVFQIIFDDDTGILTINLKNVRKFIKRRSQFIERYNYQIVKN